MTLSAELCSSVHSAEPWLLLGQNWVRPHQTLQGTQPDTNRQRF